MGKLVDGKWVEQSVITSDDSGAYDRIPRSFLDEIAEGHEKFQPESGRYHLYVSYACPWAHRTLIFRKLKKLDDHITVSVVHPEMLDDGWTFASDFYGSTGDTLYNFKFLREIYVKAQTDVSTSVTVPVLWDKKLETIVNNESSQIIRIFNSAFNQLTGDSADYYPKDLRGDIDQWNKRIYDNINNGVYRAGFAKNQKAYDQAISSLFETLDSIENHLEGKTYLVGDQLTEADLRLLPSLLRFDPVYNIHFKCSKKAIRDFKNLRKYTQRLFDLDAVKSTTHFDHIVRHYFYSHKEINPYQIVPEIDIWLK